MKDFEARVNKVCFFTFLFIVLFSCVSCQKENQDERGKGELVLFFNDSSFVSSRAEVLPDSSQFILRINNSDGKVIYEGSYGKFPASMLLDAGNYTVSIKSSDFSAPAFDKPQYGDEQVFVIESGKTTSVKLQCEMINCGIRLILNSDFLIAYPDAHITVESDKGRLMYAYREKRVAYFHPGTVNVFINTGSKKEKLFSRKIEKKTVLSVKINIPAKNGKVLSFSLDTSKNYISEEYTVGRGKDSGKEGSKGKSKSSALSVYMAKSNVGAKDVWVYGYIIGCMRGANIFLTPPFTVSSNVAIAGKPGATDKDDCIILELKRKNIVSTINIMSNPDNVGRKVFVKGEIVPSYFGVVGVKNISDAGF